MGVVGICRFSLVGKGDWKAFQGATPEQVAAATKAQAETLFDPERMEARLKSFDLLTLASLKAQTDQDFRFIVLSSNLMPAEYRRRLKVLCQAVPQVVLKFFPEITAPQAQRMVFRELGIPYQDTLQFRLDDDDCLCSDFIALMKEHTAEQMLGEGIFVASVRNVLYSCSGGKSAGVYLWPVEFMSAGAAIRHPSKSIYEFGHFGMAERFPKVVIGERMALVTNNGTNDTQFNESVIVKRGMVKQEPIDIGRAVGEFFPFLSREAMKIAGLMPQASAPEDTPQPAPPNWYADLLHSRFNRGFFLSNELFALQHTLRSKSTLYVSFDNLSSVRGVKGRDPWGYSIAAKSEWSSLGILCYWPNWFRIPALYEELGKLADKGFFDDFEQVVFTGTSMGAYAACAFSSLAPGCTVVAFSPQSTLSSAIAQWDSRYPSGTKADWTGPFADAACEIHHARKAWIVYDPFDESDRKHAERLNAPNVSLLKARYSRHYTAQFLGQIGMLGAFVRACACNEMTEAQFYQLYRKGREFRRYLDGFAAKVATNAQPQRAQKLAGILRAMNKPALANTLERSIAADR